MSACNIQVSFFNQSQVRDFLLANPYTQLFCQWKYGEFDADCVLYAGKIDGIPCIMYATKGTEPELATSVLNSLFDNGIIARSGTLKQFLQPKGN